MDTPAIRGLSVLQPWASLLAIGAKRFETRAWPTKYRGLLAIHASQSMDRVCRELCQTEPFKSSLAEANYESAATLPRGCVVAVAVLKDCVQVKDGLPGLGEVESHRNERAFGDWMPGRWAWRLTIVTRTPPIPCKGALGLWAVPPGMLRSLGL